MTPKTAASLLSLPLRGPWTVDEVGAAFRETVRTAHPDSGGKGADMAALKEARDVLLTEADKEAEIGECPRCEGTGLMKTRSGRRISCSTCGGSGEYRERKFDRDWETRLFLLPCRLQ